MKQHSLWASARSALMTALRATATAAVTATLAGSLLIACTKPEITGKALTGATTGPTPEREPVRPAADRPDVGTPTTISLPDADPTAGDAAIDLLPATPETCAETSHTATRVPLDVFFLLDASGSMSGRVGTRTKLDLVRDAVNSFLKDPSSAGLGVALTFFPGVSYCETDNDCPKLGVLPGRCLGVDTGCVTPGMNISNRLCIPNATLCPPPSTCAKVGRCADAINFGYCVPGTTCPGGGACVPIQRTCNAPYGSDCMGTRYAKPVVDFGELPTILPALAAALEKRQPYGSTPLGEGLAGTLPFLRTYLTAHPGRQVVLVIASDGVPDPSCGGVPAILTSLTDAHAAKPSLPTYAIGVFGALELATGRTLMTDIAKAGGTNLPYVIEPNVNLAEAFLKALNEIRGAALPCEFMIPSGKEGIDYSKLNLDWKSPMGNEAIGYVGAAGRCDAQKGGWYYDVDPATGGKPTRVVVCPATCAKLKSDSTGKVELRFGCKTRVID